MTVGRGELIAIIGGSGSGKTTLLNTMCGLRPPVAGEVIRAEGACVGYVPQDDIIHLALPLKRTLRYAAQLRHVPDPDGAVQDVLRTLELASRQVVPVGHLSGGERKRASIAAELLAQPGLFFLDEPTSGLDPARGTELMRTLRRLSNNGTTVVLTTHNPLDAEVCDKVAVLAFGGHLAFFGTPAAARGYFGTNSLVEIYEQLAGVGDPARNWSRRYFDSHLNWTTPIVSPAALAADAADAADARNAADAADFRDGGDAGEIARPSPAATGTVTLGLRDDPLDRGTGDGWPGSLPARLPDQPIHPRNAARAATQNVTQNATQDGVLGAASAWSEWSAWALRPIRQWALLTRRDADILTRSKLTAAMLAGSPLAVLLMFLVLFRPGAFDPARPSPAATVMIMFWVAFGGFFFGLTYGLLAICTEWGVLRRERFAGLGAGAYVLAKVCVLLPLLAAVDLIFLAVLRLLGRLPAAGDSAAVFVTLLLCSAAALGLGLLISAAVAEPSQATIAMPMACFPQVLFVGAILPVPVMAAVGRWISFAMTNTWAFEALGHSLGVVRLWSNGRSSLGRPLLMTYGTTFDRPLVVDWLVLSGFTVAFVAATIAIVARKTR
jgi:ABC-type multidrug transport system ATPase subunit